MALVSKYDEQNSLGLTHTHTWSYKEAPSPSDIEWEMYCTKFNLYNLIFSILLTLILLLFVIVCVNPISFLTNMKEMRKSLEGLVG